MKLASIIVTAVAALMLAGPPASARAGISACRSAHSKSDPEHRIDLFRICLEGGGISRNTRANAHLYRGATYFLIGEYDEAIADLDSALEINDRLGAAYFYRGQIYLNLEQYERAIPEFTAMLTRRPSQLRHYAYAFRGAARVELGDVEGGLSDYDEAIERARRNAYPRMYKAWLRATYPDPARRDGDEALALAQEAVELEDSAWARRVLAAAYAERGQFEQAAQEQFRAITMYTEQHAQEGGPSENDVAAMTEYQAHLALYQSGEPLRTSSAQ